MFSEADKSTLENTIERATFRNPFIQEFTLNRETETDTFVQFVIVEPLSPVQIRRFGERLYDSFRESGLLVNILFESYDDATMTFRLRYTGQRVQ